MDKHDPYCKGSLSEMSDKYNKYGSTKKIKLSVINSLQ